MPRRTLSEILSNDLDVGESIGGGRKCGHDFAGNREQPKFFLASIIAEFGDEAFLQTANQAVAVRRGHH
jgi:hypothetical protein